MSLVGTWMAFSIVGSLAYLAAVALAGVYLALRAGVRHEDLADDRDALSASRFTIPVSLVLRVNGSADAADTDRAIAALLDLNYPELEVIVIAEAAAAAVWSGLKGGWQLEAREFFYRASLPTAPITMMYRSARDARLLVVDKAPDTLADALNCGINLARFRYVSAIDRGVVFDGDALLRAMAAPLRDPA